MSAKETTEGSWNVNLGMYLQMACFESRDSTDEESKERDEEGEPRTYRPAKLAEQAIIISADKDNSHLVSLLPSKCIS